MNHRAANEVSGKNKKDDDRLTAQTRNKVEDPHREGGVFQIRKINKQEGPQVSQHHQECTKAPHSIEQWIPFVHVDVEDCLGVQKGNPRE